LRERFPAPHRPHEVAHAERWVAYVLPISAEASDRFVHGPFGFATSEVAALGEIEKRPNEHEASRHRRFPQRDHRRTGGIGHESENIGLVRRAHMTSYTRDRPGVSSEGRGCVRRCGIGCIVGGGGYAGVPQGCRSADELLLLWCGHDMVVSARRDLVESETVACAWKAERTVMRRCS
jgi:hypothetical protein